MPGHPYRRLRGVESLHTVMQRHRGIGPGFDALRLLLAVGIFYEHVGYALRGTGLQSAFGGTDVLPGVAFVPLLADDSWPGILREIKDRLYVIAVPMFFALSGFLVTGSAERLGAVGTFLKFRVLRIRPALSVEVCLSAILLGGLFSTLSFQAYVTDPQFLRYFGNIVGHMSFRLPGVFTDNPTSDLVNANLWTLPAEFYCYLAMGVLMAAGVLVRQRLSLALFAAVTVALVAASLTAGLAVRPAVWSVTAVVYCFFAGMIFYQWRTHVPMNGLLFAAAVLVVLLLIRDSRMTFLMPLPLTYVVVWLGHATWLALPVLKGRDYSYGVYLYGFPITQAVVAVEPDLTRIELLVVALSVTLAFAALSWHLVEKPFLALKDFSFSRQVPSLNG